jgi:hypothetical protein
MFSSVCGPFQENGSMRGKFHRDTVTTLGLLCRRGAPVPRFFASGRRPAVFIATDGVDGPLG